MERRLEGRVALVTGASRGLGRAIALRLAADGARVAVNYARSAAGAEDVVGLIREQGGDAVALRADVTDEAQARGLVEGAAAHFGADVAVIVNKRDGAAAGADHRAEFVARLPGPTRLLRQGAFPAPPSGAAGDASARRGRGRQHRQRGRVPGRRAVRDLRGGEGRRDRADQVLGHRARACLLMREARG